MAYAVVALYKVILLIIGKSVMWFAVSNTIDYFLISIILFAAYRKMGTQKLSFSLRLGKKMLGRSKHYIVSAMMVTVFQQTDRIMLKLMCGDVETGYYSAAVACAGVTGFVYVAIIDSMRPTILEKKNNNSMLYESRLVQLYSVITYLSLAQGLAMTILAKPLVLVLYSEQYLSSIAPLRIVVWCIIFSYYGTIRNVWILAENKQKYLWIINLSGALVNVLFNLYLIPIMGTEGAALASLITQVFTNVIIGFIIKPIRYNNTLMLKGLDPKPLILFAKNFIKSVCKAQKGVS